MSDSNIPKSKLKRAGVAGQTAAKIGAKKAQFLMKSAFLQKEKKQEAKLAHDQELAETLFRGLSRLRGTALKLAQALCSETGILPPAYLKQLERACYQVPPLNRAVVYQVIESELGDSPNNIFKEFDSKAFAAASLGQVHKAVTHDGQTVAVKIQYPGIQTTIDNDLKMIQSFFTPIKKNHLLKRTFDEVKARLLEETDYRTELENTLWFAGKSLNVNIPQVFPQFSSEKVLTTSFIEGAHLKEWLEQNPSAVETNKTAQALIDFFWQSLTEFQRIHSDPNLGNYLFSEAGKITVIDFGSTKQILPIEAEAFTSLWLAQDQFEPKRTAKLYQQLGASLNLDDPVEVQTFVEQVILPYRNWVESLPHTFSSQSSYVLAGQNILNKSAEDPRLKDFSIGFTMVHRTLFGCLQALQKMNAKVNLRPKIAR